MIRNKDSKGKIKRNLPKVFRKYSYQNQIDRTKRSLVRFLKYKNPFWQEYTDQFEHCQDAGYHFFQDCWHIRDWIKHDKYLELTDNQIKQLKVRFSENKYLQICNDIANGSKHLLFDKTGQKNSKRDFDPGIMRIGPDFKKNSAKMSILMFIDGRSAYDIAKKCFEEVLKIAKEFDKDFEY